MGETAQLIELLTQPFYLKWDFWIANALGLAGLVFSVLAWIEAKDAKAAAKEAGAIVKIQTITIELTEIAQRLDKLDLDVSFPEVRDFLNEVTRRLLRLIAPFQTLPDVAEKCELLKQALSDAKVALNGVRPSGDGEEAVSQNAIYFATQEHFSSISSLVAELMGLFEKRTIGVSQ